MQTLCQVWKTRANYARSFCRRSGGAQFAERLTIDRLRDLATQATQTRHYTPAALSANDPANVREIFCPGLHIRQRWFQRVGRVRWWSFLAANCYSYLAQGGKKMLVWQEKEELLAPEVFHALTTAPRRELWLRFTLTEVDDLPVRQTPMFTLLREAGFSSSPQGLDWG
ncbi:ATP-dependent helicase [Escherichia coli]